jgi:hypothetical protein
LLKNKLSEATAVAHVTGGNDNGARIITKTAAIREVDMYIFWGAHGTADKILSKFNSYINQHFHVFNSIKLNFVNFCFFRNEEWFVNH